MNKLHALTIRLAVALALAGGPPAAVAQVPPHTPGTICATPMFWCWAAYAGRPGTACACQLQNRWVQGVLI